MVSNLTGSAISKGVSTDDVVRTIQALISAGYKGEELLDKIDEIYGVGARNNLLKVIDYTLPMTRTTVVIQYPQISPAEKTKVGDILIGSNGYIGQITAVSFDTDDVVSAITVLGLEYNICEAIDTSLKIVLVRYNELVSLRDSGSLIPGCQYRIIDYVCTVANNSEARVNTHSYDIIVVADDEHTLNENARACLHAGDTYYSNAGANLSAWELKYCLDNDTNRFAWADTNLGRGVIYWLKDEWDNECSYDFKQITFKRYYITSCDKSPSLVGFYSTLNHNSNIVIDIEDTAWFYTFDVEDNGHQYDYSVQQYLFHTDEFSISHCYNNVIKPYHICNNSDTSLRLMLNNNVIITYSEESRFVYPCFSNFFDVDCCENTLKESYNNVFGCGCSMNVADGFFIKNIFNKGCSKNAFGLSFFENELSSNCSDNIFGSNCGRNKFDQLCKYISFGGSSEYNTFGIGCNNITFGSSCTYNTFKNGCNNIEFKTASTGGTVASCFSYNTVESGDSYLTLWNSDTASTLNIVKNYIIMPGVSGSLNNMRAIELDRNNSSYTIVS